MALHGDKKRQYQREWTRARRSAYFTNKSCVQCGSTEQLELDHKIPEDKLFNPTALWSMADSNPNKIAELLKCQVLCHLCHKKKTAVYLSEIFATVSKTMVCKEGHDLNVVGFKVAAGTGTKWCKLCTKIYDAQRTDKR